MNMESEEMYAEAATQGNDSLVLILLVVCFLILLLTVALIYVPAGLR